MNNKIEFEDGIDINGSRRIKINPGDSMELIAAKLNECHKQGIKAHVIIGGVEYNNFTNQINHQPQTKLEKNGDVIESSSFLQREKNSSNDQEKNRFFTSSIDSNLKNQAEDLVIKEIEVTQNDTVESVAKKLEYCSFKGINATASINDIVLDNFQTRSVTDILKDYQDKVDKERALKEADIILEKDVKYESQKGFNARHLRPGKYDRIDEIIKKLKYLKELGINTYVVFNGVELNNYDFKFKLDDTYKMKQMYFNSLNELQQQNQNGIANKLSENNVETNQNSQSNSSLDQNQSSNPPIIIDGKPYQRGGFVDNQIFNTPEFNEYSSNVRAETPSRISNPTSSSNNNNSTNDLNINQPKANNINKDQTPSGINQGLTNNQINSNMAVNSSLSKKQDNKYISKKESSNSNNAPQIMEKTSEIGNQLQGEFQKRLKRQIGMGNIGGMIAGQALSNIAPPTVKQNNVLLYDPNVRDMNRINEAIRKSSRPLVDEDEEDLVSSEDNVENSDLENSQTDETSNTGENQNEEEPKIISPTPLPDEKGNKESVVKKLSKEAIIEFLKKHPAILLGAGIAIFIIVIIFLIIMAVSYEEKNKAEMGLVSGGNASSSCSNSEGNLVTFLDSWEGNEGTCTTSDNLQGYAAKNLGDGTITIGYGVTNHDFTSSSTAKYINENNWSKYFRPSGSGYRVNSGDCVPIDIIDKIKLNSLENRYAAPIDRYAEQYGVTLNQHQKDALTSFNYNLGEGNTEKLISAYASGGEEGLWNVMKNYMHAKINGVSQELDGLKKRRKGEFALFVTGDYTDQGKFYSRSISNYDDYNSEGVMERKLVCSENGMNGSSGSTNEGGYSYPLPISANARCTSPFSRGNNPLTGAAQSHSGLDIGVDGGTEIYAVKSGTVTEIENNKTGSGSSYCSGVASMGNYVKITHDDGTKSVYMHMQHGSVVVKVGDKVTQGQMVGRVGTTGCSTGNHLHITLRDVNNELIDPADYLDLSPMTDTSRCK